MNSNKDGIYIYCICLIMIISASIALIVTTVPNSNIIHNISIYLDLQLVPINMVFYPNIIVRVTICEVFGGSWHTTVTSFWNSKCAMYV